MDLLYSIGIRTANSPGVVHLAVLLFMATMAAITNKAWAYQPLRWYLPQQIDPYIDSGLGAWPQIRQFQSEKQGRSPISKELLDRIWKFTVERISNQPYDGNLLKIVNALFTTYFKT